MHRIDGKPRKQAVFADSVGRYGNRGGVFLNRESEVRILPGARVTAPFEGKFTLILCTCSPRNFRIVSTLCASVNSRRLRISHE